MLGWLRRRRETAERIDAEAEALMRRVRYPGVCRSSAARTRGEEQSRGAELEPRRVVDCAQDRQARRPRHLDPDGVRRDLRLLASRTVRFACPDPHFRTGPPDELSRLVSDDTRRGYCIQFLGPGSDQTQTVLAEVEVRASDVSTAMREAARTPGPRVR